MGFFSNIIKELCLLLAGVKMWDGTETVCRHENRTAEGMPETCRGVPP